MTGSESIPVLALDHGALRSLGDEGRLGRLGRLVNLNVRVFKLALETHVLLSECLNLCQGLLQLLLEPTVVFLKLCYLFAYSQNGLTLSDSKSPPDLGCASSGSRKMPCPFRLALII